MQFIAPQAGAAEINLAVTTPGVARSYKGYWVGSYPPPNPASNLASQAHLATRPMTAVPSTAWDASAGGYSQTIDVSSLTAGGKTTITLPNGAVGNSYALTLTLTNCTATDKFSWTVSDDARSRVKITQSGGANQTVLFTLANLSDSDISQPLQVTVQLTKTSAAPPVTYTLLFEIAVIKCDAVRLEPTVLPPVVVDTAYTQNLVASGARGNFAWSVDASSLPPGLTWDPSSRKLSSTVTDATQVDTAFSLQVAVAASDVIIEPVVTTLVLTVQSAAAVAIEVPPLPNLLAGTVPCCLVLMGIFAAAIVGGIKGWKDKKKAVELAQAADQYIEILTHGDPKSVGQAVVRDVDAMLRIVQRDLIPYSQKLIDNIDRVQRALHTKIQLDEDTMNMLNSYIEDHESDDDDVQVRDEDLNKLGLETYGQVKKRAEELVSLHLMDQARLKALSQAINSARSKDVSNRDRIRAQVESKSRDESFLRMQ
jgi:hypothetical protein